jgi:hypothetical protein
MCKTKHQKISPKNLQLEQLVALEDKNIVVNFSSIIHNITNYYLFVKRHSSLWKVMFI